MPEPPVRESSDPRSLEPRPGSDEPDAAPPGTEPGEPDRRARGLLARADRAESRGEDPEHWRRSVVLRFDRIERLLERVASALPPLEEHGRRTAERGDERMSRLEEVTGQTLERLDTLATAVEGAAQRVVRELEERIERQGSEGSADLVEGLGVRVRSAVDEAQGRTAREVGEIRTFVTDATAGLQDSMGRVAETQDRLARDSDELARTIKAERKDTVDAVRSFSRTAEAALRRSTEEVVKALRAETTGAVRALREEVRTDLEGLRDAIAESLAGVQAAVASDVSGVRQAVEEATAAIPEAAGAAEASVRQAAENVEASLRQGTETQIAVLRQEVDAATQQIATGQSSLDQLVTSLIGQDQRAVDVLGAAIQRIEGLAEVIESLGARRGFRQLVQSEEELREQQIRLVEDLKAEGEALAAGIQDVERRMQGLEAHVAEEMSRTVDAVRSDLEKRIPVDESLGDVRDLAQAHRDLDKAATILRDELEVLRKRIESWGVPRSAPRLAANLAAVEKRVGTLEELLSDQVVRLEDLIKAGEQQLERMSEGRRGVFRRS